MTQQVWLRPAPLPATAPHESWASLPTPVKTSVAEIWSLISNSAAEIVALISARHRADLAGAAQAATQAEELTRRRKTASAEAQAVTVRRKQHQHGQGTPSGSGDR